MSLTCNLNINKDHCAVNFSASRSSCQAAAFVLHGINNFTSESYLNFVKEKFLQGRDYYLPYPKSVHFLIGENGAAYQLLELHDRAWGIGELNEPSWPLLNQCSWSDYEDLFIHIAFIGQTPSQTQLDVAAQIMCCTVINEPSINIPINETGIIVARDLDIDSDCLWEVPDSVIPKTQVCIQNNGQDPFFIDDIGTYGTRISNLETWQDDAETRITSNEVCCCENKAAIAALEEALAELQEEVSSINVDDLEQRLATLEAGNFEIWKAIRTIENCLDCANICTPETPQSIHYRLDLSTPVKLVPGVIQHINLPIKVRDVDPPIVTTGPLWHAELLEEAQTLCTTFKIKGSARLSSSEWCAGRVLEMYFIVNSENILADTYTAEGGSQSAFVYGETLFTVPPDTVVYMGLKTDEDTFPLEVIQASVEIECLDGLLSPNCLECNEP